MGLMVRERAGNRPGASRPAVSGKRGEPSALERLALAARLAGVPRGQLENFLSAGYVPQRKQLEFHAAARLCDAEEGPDQVGFGGARGPGKSHAVFAQVALDDCRRFSGAKALYLRRVGKQAREQFEDLRRRVLVHVPHRFNSNAGVVSLWGDSRIFIGHFNSEADIDLYLGIEYDFIVIEEATGLSLAKYKALRDSNRSSKAGLRPRIYLTTNPGGIGHTWFFQRFVQPWRMGQESTTRFIPATVDDNRFVDAGYRLRLEENTGWKLRAYRYGDWEISAGQFFTTWRHDVHVRRDVKINPSWRVWCSLDYGFTHPTVVYLFAQDNDGTIYVVDEHRQSRWLVGPQAQAIVAMLDRHGVTVGRLERFVAGGDVFAQRGTSETTIAEQYAQNGIVLTRANDDRVSGAAQILQRLGDGEASVGARLFVAERCSGLIETMPRLEHDPNRPEDVLKVDIDEDGQGGDDCYDSLRYGVMAAPAVMGGSFVRRYA